MLKKFENKPQLQGIALTLGLPVYIITRKGEIQEGFHIKNILGDLVELDKSPIDGTEVQGFTIENDMLKPNWCSGKKLLYGATVSKTHALSCAAKIK